MGYKNMKLSGEAKRKTVDLGIDLDQVRKFQVVGVERG